MYYFIVNEHGASGQAKAVWAQVEQMMKDRGMKFKRYISQDVGHASKIAAHICAQDDDDIRMVVVGGDGTINEVLNGITDFDKISFGLIPTGSGNDFSRGMKIPRDTKKAMDLILDSTGERRIDLGVVHADGFEPKVFGISAGIGLDAIVTKKTNSSRLKKVLNKFHLGNLTYIILTVTTLFSMRTYHVEMEFDGENKEVFDKAIFLAGMNLPSEGGGVPMAPDASPFDGKLSLCMAHGIPKIATFFKLPLLTMGKHTKLKGFMMRDFDKVSISSDQEMTVHADGEYAGDACAATIECKKQALRILV